MKLISLNVEGGKHWELINPFLEAEHPDVLCVQELFEEDAAPLAARLGMHYAFTPMFLWKYNGPGSEPSWQKFGVGIFSRAPLTNIQSKAYYSPSAELQRIDEASVETQRKTGRQVLLFADIECDGATYTIATTHFTWTPNGLPSEYQRTDADALLALLADIPNVVLCGDLNISRSMNELYEKFTAKYEDAIPRSYISSMDIERHRDRTDPVSRARLEQCMVDYLFLTSAHRAENVRLQSGVSDHCAIVGTVLPA